MDPLPHREPLSDQDPLAGKEFSGESSDWDLNKSWEKRSSNCNSRLLVKTEKEVILHANYAISCYKMLQIVKVYWESKKQFDNWMAENSTTSTENKTRCFQLRKRAVAGAYQGRISIPMPVLLFSRHLLGIAIIIQGCPRLSFDLVCHP